MSERFWFVGHNTPARLEAYVSDTARLFAHLGVGTTHQPLGFCPTPVTAGGESPGASTAKRRKQNKQRSSSSVQAPKPELVRLESLPWRSVSEHDTFDFLDGSSEGGFPSLEEIDESEYGIIGGDVVEAFAPSKKRCKQLGKDGTGLTVPGGEENKTNKQKKNKKKKKEKQIKKTDVPVNIEEVVSVDVISKDRNDAEEGLDDQLAVDKSEYNAWKELRLHPLLMKSIYRLGFKEPTPIQKSCIPAAAHQGKDVIGAAETGSGKTLAFGLPILHRLLEEQEKGSRFVKEEKMVDEVDEGGPLRALVVIPTRELALQVTDHLKEAAKFTNIKVVPIVGGMSSEKQERLLKKRPEIVVGTPGRLWELISGREQHLVELHWLSFFVLDEADRMIENGHFHELQSIIDMLPTDSSCTFSQISGNCKTVPNLKLKKRQTCVFSATIALSENFRKKLKHKASNPKSSTVNELNSIEILSQRAGIRDNVAIFDLTKASIVAEKLEESFIECTEENKEAYLYYLLSVHGHGRTIVFCTSIAALRRIASLLHILGINAWTLHAQMQQRARLKAIDRFRGNEHAILVATDVAARGLDIPGVRTVVHFQLPHSADVYIHRSGRTARASSDGCCIALISPSDRGKFFSLCKSLSKENLLRFPLNEAYLPDILKRVSLARQIDKMMRMNSQENVKKSWFERNAKAMELMIDQSDSEEEAARIHKQKKMGSLRMQNLQQELKLHLSKPLQSKQFSHRFLAGAGVSHVLQQQLEELSKQKRGVSLVNEKKPRLVVIGQDCVEPLQALRTSGHEVCLNNEKRIETRKLANQWKRKRKEDKKRESEQRRKKKKQG